MEWLNVVKNEADTPVRICQKLKEKKPEWCSIKLTENT